MSKKNSELFKQLDFAGKIREVKLVQSTTLSSFNYKKKIINIK